MSDKQNDSENEQNKLLVIDYKARRAISKRETRCPSAIH